MELKRRDENGSMQNTNAFDEGLRQAESQMKETGKAYAGKAQQIGSAGYSKAKQVTDEIKSDMKSALSGDLSQPGRLGFALYLYAILGYGFFVFESSTALLLLTAWVIAYERNKQVMKMMLNIVVLYLALKVGWSVFLSVYNFVNYLIPDWKIFDMLTHGLSVARKFIGFAYDMIFVFIGLRGISMARKGKYIKLKFVENLFN